NYIICKFTYTFTMIYATENKRNFKGKKSTAVWLAGEVGMAQPSMSNIINGKSSPSMESLERIAAVLQMEVWELFAGSVQRNNLYGFVEYKNVVYKIDSIKALEKLLLKVKQED
ncbi:MAG: helix-turn-helix domain-containing protein, partial [Bacteroides sp.]|nr:helix-turn-helix domain-containing protein [Bacteroides sp.]